ncbi:hypothetical protein ACGFIV_31115 [Sphaerisporangium sp. NPDC049003]|uniref:hypothetical protein n=1 Tax=Sphaerisporangium sp. NPDC049003 TaxID=3364517 RepID=UPI00371987AD
MVVLDHVVLPPGWGISSRLLAYWPIDDAHKLELWPSGRTHDNRLQWYYRLSRRSRTIFAASDINSAVGARLTADELVRAARTVLAFLTLQPGGTDAEYFDGYTKTQLAWRDAYAEELSIYALEYVCGYCGDVNHLSPGCPAR